MATTSTTTRKNAPRRSRCRLTPPAIASSCGISSRNGVPRISVSRPSASPAAPPTIAPTVVRPRAPARVGARRAPPAPATWPRTMARKSGRVSDMPIAARAGRQAIERRQDPPEDVRRLGRAPGHEDVHGDDLIDAAGDGIAPPEDAAGLGAVAHRDHQLGVGRRLVRLPERHLHVARDRARDQQQVRVPGRSDEVDAEALEVVDGAREPADLELAAVAGSGIDLPDRERAAEQAPRIRLHLPHQLDGGRVAGLEGLRGEADLQDLREERHVSAAGARARARGACPAFR